MTQMLFFKGHDTTPEGAVRHALGECASILIDNPSLVVQLESVYPMGGNWDADIRIMALDAGAATSIKRKHRTQNDPGEKYDIKSPEHAKSGNPNEWRPVGMRHDGPPAAFRFGNAAHAGEVPEIPLQDIQTPGYELSRASEPELRRILLELEERRHKAEEEFNLKIDQS